MWGRMTGPRDTPNRRFGMAGKGIAIASTRVAEALKHLSKDALIDLVYDRASLETGHAGDATDEDVAEVVQGWLAPVAWARGDRPISLTSLMVARDQKVDDYANRRGKYALSPDEQKRLAAEGVPS